MQIFADRNTMTGTTKDGKSVTWSTSAWGWFNDETNERIDAVTVTWVTI